MPPYSVSKIQFLWEFIVINKYFRFAIFLFLAVLFIQSQALAISAKAKEMLENLKEIQPDKIFRSATNGDLKIINKILAENPSAADLTDETGETPLHYAARAGEIEAFKLIYAKAKNKNPKDKNGNSVLHFAVSKNELECVKFLLDEKFEIDAKNNSNKTPLTIALEENHNQMASFLLENGANKENVNTENLNVKDWLLLNFSKPANQSPKEVSIDKIFTLKTKEIIKGQVLGFTNGIYKIQTKHGELSLADKDILSISSNSTNPTDSNLKEFHKKAADILLRLCAQYSSGISVQSAQTIIPAAAAELDTVVRDFKEFSILGNHYQKCFEMLKFPIALHSISILSSSTSFEHNELINAFSGILSSDFISEKNKSLNEILFTEILDRNNTINGGDLLWYEHCTVPCINLVVPAIKNEMAAIENLIK